MTRPTGAARTVPAARHVRRGASLEAITLGLTTPVMIKVADVDTPVALAIGLGLAVLVPADRRAAAPRVGLRARLAGAARRHRPGVRDRLMFFLGTVFALLWATAYLLGRKIERERAAAYAAFEAEQR